MSATTAATVELLEIGGDLVAEVEARSGASPMSCYQCTKCSSGCPVSNRGDLKCHEVVRLVQTGQREAVLGSRFIWECTSCQTCITRCPQQVDVCSMNDALRALSLEARMAAVPAVPVFNRAFLNGVRKRGRVHELGLMAAFKLRTRRFFEDLDKAPMMLSKGKLPLLGERVRGGRQRRELFRRAVEAGATAAGAHEAEDAGGGSGGGRPADGGAS